MEENKEIFIAHRLGEIKTDSDEEYLAHMLCLGGTCKYRFNRQDFELHAGDLSIIRKRKMIEKIEASDDFRCRIIYVKPEFVTLCTPQSNYGTKGQLALFLNPVMHLNREQQDICLRDFELLEQRINDTSHVIVFIVRLLLTRCGWQFSISLISMHVFMVRMILPHKMHPL